MEIASEIASNAKSILSRYRERGGMPFPQDLLDASKFHDAQDWRHAIDSVGWKKGILNQMKLEDSPDNRTKVVVSFLRDKYESTIPGIISKGIIPDETMPGRGHSRDLFSNQVEYFMRKSILKNIPLLLHGKKYEKNYEENPNSLERHVYRTGVIKRVLLSRIFEEVNEGNTEAQKFKSEYDQKFKYLGVGFLQGFAHDWVDG